MSIIWLDLEDVIFFHKEQLDMFGGSAGIRDEVGLKASVHRPRTLKDYEPEVNIFRLAACYACLAKSHCFVDGNKRTAAKNLLVFLYINGYRLELDETKLPDLMVGFSLGDISEEELANILEVHSVKRPVKT